MVRNGRRRIAALKDASNKLRKEECASGTEQRLKSIYAAVKVAQTRSSMEECVRGMEQRSSTRDAAVRDALI